MTNRYSELSPELQSHVDRLVNTLASNVGIAVEVTAFDVDYGRTLYEFTTASDER